MDEPTTDYATPRAALAAGARDALGAPIAVLAAGYVGYGALASGFDFPPLLIVASTLLIWALPGQLIMLEMHAVSAQLVLIVLAVSLSTSRLPMTTVLSAMMRHPRYSSWQMYASAHLLAMKGWVAAVNRVPQLPAEQRLPYFVGFALFCWIACAAASAVGYFVAGQMSELVKLGLVFMNPIYFLLILTGETKVALGRLSLAAGAITGPVAYALAPQWSLLAAGLVGGSAPTPCTAGDVSVSNVGVADLWVLILACAAGTYLWRALGVAVAGRLDPDGEIFSGWGAWRSR